MNSIGTSKKSAETKKVKINGKEILVKISAAGKTVSAVPQQKSKVEEEVSEKLETAVKRIGELEAIVSALAQQSEAAAAAIKFVRQQLCRREDRQLLHDPRQCRHHQAGRCFFGNECRFRHSVASTRAPRRSQASRPPPSPAPPARTARAARSPSAPSSSTSKLASLQQVPQSPESHSTPTLRSAGEAYYVNPDLLVVDEEKEHIKGSEKPAAILHNEKQDKMPASAKFGNKFQCKSSLYSRHGEDKFVSGLVKFLNEHERKESDGAPSADDMWIVVTRRRSSRRSSRRSPRRRGATPDASKASFVSPS